MRNNGNDPESLFMYLVYWFYVCTNKKQMIYNCIFKLFNEKVKQNCVNFSKKNCSSYHNIMVEIQLVYFNHAIWMGW